MMTDEQREIADAVSIEVKATVIAEAEKNRREIKRASLISHLQNWGWKLDQCCYGKLVHTKGQPRQQIIAWLQLLEKPDVSLDQVDKIDALMPAVINTARRLYPDHIGYIDAERELAAECDGKDDG